MKLNRIFASMLLLAVTASTSFAAGAVSLTWNSCVGPVNLAVAGGAPVDAYVSVLGQTLVAQSYQVVTTGGQPGGIRDAWRFDPAGCDAGFFTLNHLAPAAVSKTCPSFQGALQSLQIKDYSYDSTTGKVKITLANAYPNGGAGNPGAVTGTTHYFLANYHFDLTFGVPGPGSPPDNCGGVDVPACFVITSASWLDTAGSENPWAHASNDWITTNDPNDAQKCPGSVPTQQTSWGRLKSQYH